MRTWEFQIDSVALLGWIPWLGFGETFLWGRFLYLKIQLTLVREFLGPSPSAFSGKKSKIIAVDVTVRTKKIKILCVYTVSVRLSYDVNFNWHMPICAEICRAEQKYMPFFGTITERDFRKKIHSTETYTNWFNAALWIFFPQNTLGDGPAFWIFFQDSRIRVKEIHFRVFLEI